MLLIISRKKEKNRRNLKIAIGLPAFNEGKNIASIIAQLKKKYALIIVCDDGSSDFTSIIAEEMGLLFALAIVILLILIIARGFMVAKHAPDQFGRLLVSGIIIWFATQSFLNIGAIVGILPLTGVPLPFISHGGTALMIAMGAVGIVVNVSKQT